MNSVSVDVLSILAEPYDARQAERVRGVVAELIEAATALAEECDCSLMQRAHGHHFGCSTKDLRVALANCGSAP